MPSAVGGCITHVVPAAQSSLEQQKRVHWFRPPSHVKAAAQKGPLCESQAPQAGTVLLPGKHLKPSVAL